MVRFLGILGIAAASWTCIRIDGGAVELSWEIRTPDARTTSCDLRSGDQDFVDFSQVRVCWEPVVPDRELTLACDLRAEFACEAEHGVSGFEIEPGPTAFWIEPLCDGTGSPPPSSHYEVPAPIVRDVAKGAIITLSALLIVAQPDACQSL
jgi:hypothetical protein